MQVLYGKMFLALGLPWIFDVLHNLVHGNHEHMEGSCTSGGEILHRILSMFGLCRGVFLFLIFACKKSVWKKLKKVKWLTKILRKQSIIRKEKKRRQENGKFVNSGFVKSGETNFTVLSTGSTANIIEETSGQQNDSLKNNGRRFSKANLSKSVDNLATRARNSDIREKVLSKCIKATSLDFETSKELKKKEVVELSSFNKTDLS